jgi:hypothetical protein
MLQLTDLNQLTFPATYKVTDIQNGLFIETLSANAFSPNATLSLFVPNYTASGNNLGQMDFSSIPSVGAGQYVIWGDYYWINNTASPITPTITDDVTLGGGLTKLAKSSGSIYDILNLECVVDASLNIGSIYNASNDNTFAFSPPVSFLNPSVNYVNSPINHPFILSADVTLIRNYKSGNPINGELFNGLDIKTPYRNNLVSSNVGGMSLSIGGDLNKVKENKGRFFNIDLETSNNTFQGNKSDVEGCVYNAIKLVNTSRFTGNKAVGGKSSLPNASNSGIGYIELFDNCQMIGNECNGESSTLWDVRTGENCKFDSNIINSNAVASQHCGFNDINMMQFDEVIGNVLNGDDVIVEVINMLGHSKFNNNTFNGNGTGLITDRWSGFQMLRSEITDNTMNANAKYWRDIWMSNAKLRNATDIQVQNCTFEGINLDLTGFTTDITSQIIQSGKGWMTNTISFSSKALIDGDSLLFDIIPTGSYVTSIKAIGSISGAGATLSLGLQTDAPSLISAPVAGFADGEIYSSISVPATANRSLQLKATGGTINSGTLVVMVEFMTTP